jgi:hypothetical protein
MWNELAEDAPSPTKVPPQAPALGLVFLEKESVEKEKTAAEEREAWEKASSIRSDKRTIRLQLRVEQTALIRQIGVPVLTRVGICTPGAGA